MKTHKLTKDGNEVFRGTENECYIKLLNSQSQSTEWAMKYEGWEIKPIQQNKF